MKEENMAKGYWVAHVDVSDPEAYKAYVAANGPAFAAFGGRFLVRGGKCEVVEGKARSRNVVIEFESYEKALACYHSAEYTAARKLRERAAESDAIVIEGYDGPQPG
jgi:uncharacterized protein (DUF1330 family)